MKKMHYLLFAAKAARRLTTVAALFLLLGTVQHLGAQTLLTVEQAVPVLKNELETVNVQLSTQTVDNTTYRLRVIKASYLNRVLDVMNPTSGMEVWLDKVTHAFLRRPGAVGQNIVPSKTEMETIQNEVEALISM